MSVGCGGGSDSADSEQTESLNDTGEYEHNSEARGNSGAIVDLSTLTAYYTARDGETLTGTLGANAEIYVAYDAIITLKDVTINGVNSRSYEWAGINCKGNATIILEGTNSVKGFYEDFPAIHVSRYGTLMIKGRGSLTASSNGYGAGIGRGHNVSCGNIVIGGKWAAGIGGGFASNCDYITITDNIAKVTATKDTDAKHSIGTGTRNCGTVTVGINVGSISTPQAHYEPITVDLSTLSADYTAQNGITLNDVTINGAPSNSYRWAGINCEGDATIILWDYPGIHVPWGSTLTIKGSGSLYACSNGWGAGIGGGNCLPCGNIVIEDGTSTAMSGADAAGISGGHKGYCGNITINARKVTATKGNNAPYSVGQGERRRIRVRFRFGQIRGIQRKY